MGPCGRQVQECTLLSTSIDNNSNTGYPYLPYPSLIEKQGLLEATLKEATWKKELMSKLAEGGIALRARIEWDLELGDPIAPTFYILARITHAGAECLFLVYSDPWNPRTRASCTAKRHQEERKNLLGQRE